MEFTKELADFVTTVSYDDLNQEIIQKGKEAFLDCMGVMIAGVGEEIGAKILGYVSNQCKNGSAPILGSSVRATSTDAALAMGTLAHALDFDDVYWPMIGHPSVTILPVILALSDACKISGKKAIEAYITGFEVEAILGQATSEYHYHKGWHTTSTLGPFGAAAAAAKILNLNHVQFRNALGIAASHASGLRQNFGTMTKPLHAGQAARGGLVSALLAKEGFTADNNIIEADLGFVNVFCGKGNHKLDEVKFKPRPVKNWALLKPGRDIKRYCSCGCTQTAIDCIREIAAENNLKAADIEKIECLVNPNIRKILIRDRAKTALEGKFSMPYCVAVALIDGDAGLKQFTDERVMRKDVQDLHRKVSLVEHDLKTIYEVIVKVKSRKGSFEKASVHSKGSPENPMSYSEMTDKFKMCVEGILTAKAAEAAIKEITRLEGLKNIGSLVKLCCP
jgi:2-methylcitrate dehydratase PrpD